MKEKLIATFMALGMVMMGFAAIPALAADVPPTPSAVVTKSNTTGGTINAQQATRDITFTSGDLGGGTSMTDVDVSINWEGGDFPWMEDLALAVVSPMGTQVDLVYDDWGIFHGSSVASTYDNFFEDFGPCLTVYDDEAALTAVGTIVPAAGSWRPQEPLSAFDGQDGTGTWTIKISDYLDNGWGDTTIWTSMSIAIECTPTIDPDVNVTGPTGVSNNAATTITYDVNGAPTTYNLWYSTDGGTNWNFIANDADGDGSYAWTAPGDGVYDFYASTNDVGDPDPTGGETPEAGTWTLDQAGPTAVPTPADTATDIATALGTYTITFNESMQAVGTIATDDLPAGSGWSWTSTTTYEKTGLPALTEETTYNVVLNSDFLDLAGNAVTGDITFEFTTADETGPTAAPTPADTATDIATALGTYTITFNEPMNFMGGFTTDDLPAGSGWSWTSTTTLEKTGLPALTEETTYNVVLDGNYQDDSGNTITGDITFEFTTADETGPTATPTPADTATDIATALGTYTITFNESMQAVGTIATDDLPAGSGWSWTSTITYEKTGLPALTEETTYNVVLNSDFLDLAGNAVTGDITFNFTTDDETGPTAVPTPADTATDIATALGTYTITFNEPMQAVGTLATDDLPAGSGWSWTSTTTYEKTGLPALTEETTYNVVLNGDFLDLAGNTVTTVDVAYEFTTDDETEPTATPTPADGATGVATALGTYTITFNEPMNPIGGFTTDDLPAGSGWSWTTATTLEKTGLPALTEQTVYNVVLDGNYEDDSGNTITGDITFDFTTDDETGPTATPTPADGATGIATALGTYTITFNEPMQAVGTLATDDLPGGSWSWATTTTYVKTGFTLAEMTTYDVILNTDFVDLAGNTVTGDITYDFTTDDETAPTAVPTPADGATGVATATASYTITFNEPMQAVGTLATDDLPGGNWSWATTTTYVKTGFTLAEATYDVILNTDFVDLAGNAVTGDITYDFTTADETAPTAAPTPADGATGVATATASYTITFNEPMQAVGTLATDDLPGGSWSWTDNTHYVKTGFTLTGYTTYNVVLNADFVDLAGNAVTGDITYDFTTDDEADPTVEAGSDEVANALFNSITNRVVNASASDIDSGIATYAWTSVPAGVIFSDVAALDTDISAPAGEEIYTVTVTVTDNSGNSAQDSFQLTWDTVAPTVVSTSPASGSVNISVVNGTLLIEFSEPITEPTSGPETNIPDENGVLDGTAMFVNVTYGNLTDLTTYYMNLSSIGITDLAGNAIEGELNITFTTGDFTAPVADAGTDQDIVEGTVVTFNGSASTDNGTIANYTWTFTDGTAQTLTGWNATYTFNNVGVFVVTLNVTDEAGNWNLSIMTVNVTSAADLTDPVADAGANQTVDEGTIVTFDGSGSSDNIGIVNYTWTFTDGAEITLYGEDPTHNFTIPGNYTVTLVVTEEAGNSANDTMQVSVEALPLDTDGDGIPDAEDENPLVADEPEEGGMPFWLWLVIILVIAGIFGFLVLGKKKKPEPVAEEPAPEPEEAPEPVAEAAPAADEQMASQDKELGLE